MAKFDIVTVSHAAELMALKLQARSIAKFVAPDAFQHIIVVCNELEEAPFREAFTQDVLPEYGSLVGRVRLIQRKSMFSGFENFHGWRTQQVLKLIAVSSSDAEFCLVLDSKNHFVRSITSTCYLAQSGKLISCYENQRGHLEDLFKKSFEYFDVDPEQYIERSLPNVTPLPLRVASIRKMLTTIESREKKTFAAFFLVWPALYAEFYLVAGFLAAKDGNFETEYEFHESRYVTLFPDKANDGALESIMFNLSRVTTLAFGIHWAARPLLTTEHKLKIAKFWLDRGLVANLQEAEKFLS